MFKPNINTTGDTWTPLPSPSFLMGPHYKSYNYYMLVISFSKGTILFYKPGLLIGGTTDHDCNPQRSIIFQLF